MTSRQTELRDRYSGSNKFSCGIVRRFALTCESSVLAVLPHERDACAYIRVKSTPISADMSVRPTRATLR